MLFSLRRPERLAATAGLAGALALTLPSIGAAAASHNRPHYPVASPKVTYAVADTPYAKLPKVPSFSLTSRDVSTGKQLPAAQRSGVGGNASPQLSWKGFPAGTKSFTVTVYDQDAGTGSGFWHWAVYNIPATTTSLPTGAGTPNSPELPAGAVQAPGDAGFGGYAGAAPPAGQTHRYFITVTALSVEKINLPPTASPALIGAVTSASTLARAALVPLATN